MAQAPEETRRHFLHPCTLFVHREEHEVSTILGSCVSVCLWDPLLKLGGMNHFMLPLWNGEGLPTPKYGNIAIEKLIERMRMHGARKERLVAKAFGGGRVILGDTGPFYVGDRNVRLALDLLSDHGIPLAGSELGGTQGYRIQFNTWTGKVRVGRIGAEDPLARKLPDGRPKGPGPGTGR